jgi:hypothetical protein
VAFHELNVGFKQLGVDEGDLIVMERFLDPRGLALTGNSTTIYAMSYLDLDQNGPMVVEVSAGSYGAIFDLWQQPIAEIGPLGVDKGAGGKFLIMPRNRADPPPAGYLPVHSRTSLAALFARGIVDDVDGAAKSLEGIRVYPLTQAHDPPATKVVLATGRDFNSIEPQGLEYWRRVSLVMERVEDDQDGGFLRSILSPLGIAPGEPFQPDARRQAILADAAEIGWAMCQAISMAPRFPGVAYYPGTHWESVAWLDTELTREYWRDLEPRTNYYFHATMAAPAMKHPAIGAGSQYLRSAPRPPRRLAERLQSLPAARTARCPDRPVLVGDRL